MPTDDTTLEQLLAQRPPAPVSGWYQITNEASSGSAATRAKINIYDAIGGWWGTNAADFVTELDALDVDELDVHVNSPGGSVWDGIAIMNALRSHRARVTITVDGIAASAASIVAMSGDDVVMAEGSQMMIHQASGGAWGNAEFMRDTAGILDKIDENLAGIYARRAGGSKDSWLDLMRDETWYNADEAVAAGLADRTSTAKDSIDAEARFDLSIFNYAGRSHAPTPRPRLAAVAMASGAPHAPASNSEPGQPNQKETTMSLDSLMAGLRERLGVTDAAADEATILTAVDTVIAAANNSVPEGVVLLDQATLDQLLSDAAQGVEARNAQIAADRAALVEAAIQDGRIPTARRDHWVAQLTADPEGGAATLASLAPGTIPVAMKGYTGGVNEATDEDQLYTKAWGNSGQTKEA